MEESEDNVSAEEIKVVKNPIKIKPKKRSLVERELETSLTARVTSPLTNGDATSTSRYGRARRLKSDGEFCDLEKNASKLKSPKLDKSPSKVQSPAYKMHASNSPVRIETPKRDSCLENQIENIYNENISLSRFSSEEKACKSAMKKFPKVYIRRDLIQSKDKEDDTVVLIKNMFSPSKSSTKHNTHLSNYLERSSEEYKMKKPSNRYLNTSSVVKTLDFDSKKKKKDEKKTALSKSELFDLEAQCEYQVGDLVWARMGTYPFWPCIVTRDPFSGTFVKKKLFGRIERDVLHVTFFGDNGRRGWIVASMLRKFHGQLEFEAARANFPPEAKKKDPRLHAAFFISDKKISQWQISVNEAEILLKEPKRLRIDILNDMLQKVKEIKSTPKHEKSKTSIRTTGDVSLSESLLDTLFSENDTIGNDADRSRCKTRNRSFDVSEVVTACLDNMAAKTGITKIQKQSHMDRWLQKAKSKTPEKSHLKPFSLKMEKDNKVSNTVKLKRKLPKKSPSIKPYNFRKIFTESQSEYNLFSHQNEHDYSLRDRETNEPVLLDDIEIEYENAEMLTSDVIEPGSGLGVISKVETLFDKEQATSNDQNDLITTVVNDECTIYGANDIQNMPAQDQISIQNNCDQFLVVEKERVLENENDLLLPCANEPKIIETNGTIETSIDSNSTAAAKFNISRINNDNSMTISLKQITNHESDNDFDMTRDQNNTLTDIAIETATVLDAINGSERIIQYIGSKIETDLHNSNELICKSLTPNVSYSILGQAEIEAVKENVTQAKVFESNVSADINTLQSVVTLKDAIIKDFSPVSTNICDKNTVKEPSSTTEKLLQNKELNLDSCSENNITILRTRSPNDSTKDCPDVFKNKGEKSTKLTIQNLVLNNELKSNVTAKNKSTDFSPQNTLVPQIINNSEYVKDGIEQHPTEPVKSKTDIKDSLLLYKTLELNSNGTENKLTSLNIMSEVSNVVTINECGNVETKGFSDNPSNTLSRNNLNQTTSDKSCAINDNLVISNAFNSNSSPRKLTSSITSCPEGSEVVHLKKKEDDGVKDFSSISKTIEEYQQTIGTLTNQETRIEVNVILNEEPTLNSRVKNKPTSFLHPELPNFVNIKKCADNEINEISDISKNSREIVTKLQFKSNQNNSSDIEYRPTGQGAEKFANGEVKDAPEISAEYSDKSYTSESKSLRQNNRELEEFETQLYNIFGLSHKKLQKSKLNLSLNKSCKQSHLTDSLKSSDTVITVDADIKMESDKKKCNKNIFASKNENALSSVIEVEKQICPSEQSYDIIRKEVRIIQQKQENMGNVTEKNVSSNDSLQIGDKHNSNKDIHNKNVLNNINLPKESGFERNTGTEIMVVNVTEAIKDKDDHKSLKNHNCLDISTVRSEVNKTSLKKTNLPADNKLCHDTIQGMENPEFLKYLEFRQDALMDERPELTEVEIINYLYKSWLYQDSLKTDIKETDAIQDTRLEKDSKRSPIKIKLSLNKSSKNNKKSYKVQITNDNEHPPVNIFNKSDFDNINKNKKLIHVNHTGSSKKGSKRLKRPNDYRTSFQKYFLSSVKKDSFSNNVLELIPKECEKDDVQIKIEIDAIKDDPCKDFANVLNKSPIPMGHMDKELPFSGNTDCVTILSPKTSQNNVKHEGILSMEKASLDDFNVDINPICDNQKSLSPKQPLSKCQSACVADDELTMKNTTDIKEEAEENSGDNISVKLEISENPFHTRTLHAKDELSSDDRKPLEEPKFLKYLELKQDALISEHPELSVEERTNYLYKTWLYEESCKNNDKKTDETEALTDVVKGRNQKATPIKRIRKKRAERNKPISFNVNSEDMTRKEKSKRKIIKPYFYKEHFSDIEDDIEFFEIFKSASRTPDSVLPDSNKTGGTTEQSLDSQMIDAEVEFMSNEIDSVEEYFRQLTVPKPNLFKGLLREKVCEICEKVDNLIKCKACHCMFHVDCVRKKPEVVDAVTTVRGRKKKKKTRGRKAKDHSNSLDSEWQSDEKSQDPNVSDEMHNTSIDNETEPYVITNVDDFEAQLALKMKELLENPEPRDYESFSSADELDWNDTDYGECKVVDVLPRKKDRELDIDYANFKCKNCQLYDTPVCFVCKLAMAPKHKAEHRQRCQVAHCHKYYHLECLDHWPQTQFNAGELSRLNNSSKLVEALTCPRHVCHTCVCDDPRGCKTRFSGDKLARCVRCPATYHTFTKCLPAGTQILTASHIICPRHYEHRPGKVPCHVNTGWCFICALGGTLICCEYCPTSFHAECLNIDPPEGGYMCEDCETGRLPLYGEMMWVKLGHYRWWPGIILHPSEVPQNILAVKHSPGEFVVRFFGQYDYYWVNRGRVFPFQEGDSGRVSSQKSKIDEAFTMAMDHAKRACGILKTVQPNEEESMDIASSLLPPHYVKLKVNKPCGSLCGKKIDIEESSLTQCECDPNELDPCGPYTQCLNRMLLTECGPTCRAGDRCNNRAFEKRLYPKMTPYRTPHRGWGLKTLEAIRSGQFVIEYVGELIDEEEFRRRMRRKQEVRDENFYYLTLDKERMIDAGPKGNLARFMNHSCEPNCETQKWTVLGDVRVGLFAMYDIPANSELTFNYNLESTGIEKKQCMCGAKRCSGYIGEKPKQDDQQKKNKPGLPTKRTYKKRKPIEASPSPKPKQRAPRPYKPRELTEIEKDLLIINNSTNGLSSDSESSRLSIDSKDSKGLKRKRNEDILSPSTKKIKTEKALHVLENNTKYPQNVIEKLII